MSNPIEPTRFEHEAFGEIRSISKNGEAYFHAKDVASALGYENTRKAIKDHCIRGEAIRYSSSSRYYDAVFIPESDVYRLVMRSKLPSAERFQDWVCNEVLPTIRKTGSYSMADANLSGLIEQNMKMLEQLGRQIRMKDEEIEAMSAAIYMLSPRASYAEFISDSPELLTVTQVAKSIGMRSAQQLNKWMHEHGIVYRQAGQWLPYADYSEKGYFHIVTHCPDGDRTYHNLKITMKGKEFITETYHQKQVAMFSLN